MADDHMADDIAGEDAKMDVDDGSDKDFTPASPDKPKEPPRPPISWEGVDKTAGMELAPGLTKYVLKEGSVDDATPELFANVNIKFDAYREDGTHFDAHNAHGAANEHHNFKIGKGRTIKGWEEGIRTMRVGEKARFVCSPEYGAKLKEYPIRNWRRTGAEVPESETTTYDVELVSFENAEPGWEKESWEMDMSEKVEAGRKRKERGNEFYKKGDFKTAAKKYDACLELFSYIGSGASDEQKAQIKEIKVSASLNLAQARLKLGDAKEAEAACAKALEEDKENTKALYRRAQALAMMGDFGRAKEEALKGIKLAPGSAELRAEYASILEREKEYRAKEKQLFGKMFASGSKQAPVKPAVDVAPAPSQAAA